MLGAIIGDIVGSRFEARNIKTKDFEFFHPDCHFTDDSIMTLAVASALVMSRQNNYENLSDHAVQNMQFLGRMYFGASYGVRFVNWLRMEHPRPFNSLGNGAAMRVSPCGLAARSLEETKNLSYQVTAVTHNHPEGIKGAEATAAAIFLAKKKNGKDEIRDYITHNYYPIDFSLDDIRAKYTFDETCPGTVPYALQAFFESEDYESTIRNAVSIGGDSDTLAAIAGGVAEAYYGIPENIKQKGLSYLDKHLSAVFSAYQHAFYTL